MTSRPLFNRAMVSVRNNRPVAEDLVMQVFQAAAEKWSELRARGAEGQRQWLFIVLRNKTVDYFRKAERERDAYRKLGGLDPGFAPDPIDLVIRYISIEEALQIIGKLPHQQHQVAVLHYLHHMTPNEIAEELGISPFTVRKHIRTVQEKLRERPTNEINPQAEDPDAGPATDESEGGQ